MPGIRWMIAMVMLSLALASCQTVDNRLRPVAEQAGSLRCCKNNERYPVWLVRLAEPAAPLVGTTISLVKLREGYMRDHPDAITLAQSRLKPLDLMVFSSKGRLSGRMLPGRFGHVAIYLGSETELRRLGVWNSPEFRPFHAQIRAGSVFMEADNQGIHLSPARRVFNTDRVAILRHPDSNNNKQADLKLFARHLGGKFDFNFDSSETDSLFCAELADHVMALGLRRTPVYGRPTILPDAIIEDAVRGRTRLSLVLYLVADEKGWKTRRPATLLADVAWP